MTEETLPKSYTTYRVEEQIGFKLRLANQKHLEIFARKSPDITPTQLAVLTKLRDTGPISQNHLGRLVAMDAATTKGVIDRLRRKGLIKSAKSAVDKRRLDIMLTDKGDEQLSRAIVAARAITDETLANLSAKEAARLLALLDKL